MSEDDLNPPASESAGGGDAGAGPSSFGARLAAARERMGLSVGDIAGRLRLHPNQVRAIESETLGRLPEPAYVRGFVRSYARLVELDPAPLLADLNRKFVPSSTSVIDGMARTSDYSPVKAAAQEQASRQVVVGLAVLGLLALGAVGWYATRHAPVEVPAPAPAVKPEAAVAVPGPAADAPAAAASAPTAAMAEPSPAASESSALPGSDTSAEAARPLLTLRFSGASWVEVTDGAGKVLLSQVGRAGETHPLTGTPPLTVVLGDASKATVEVRGAKFDLDAVTRSNVARFTVK